MKFSGRQHSAPQYLIRYLPLASTLSCAILAEFETIFARTAPNDSTIPWILGGDFNAPVGDPIFELLKPRLRDGFGEAGLGWGNTITNSGPFARIDQIWISDHWSATSVVSRRTIHSDHRMVIADLVLAGP